MTFTPPKFWDQPNSLLGYLLKPLSWLYQGGGALHLLFSKPYRAQVPVISIGNIVLGGAGKTPVTIAIAQSLQKMGRKPHIISRGYGGSLRGPVCVDLTKHTFQQVGDEPLLLAKYAPTWVSKNRKAAVKLAIEGGADVLLLDDAHQNYTLEKDMRILVVNGLQAFGNGHVFPAGPLRQSIKTGLKSATALIYINDTSDPLPPLLKSLRCPVLRANLVPLNPDPCAVMAFAGIGYPEKFRKTLLDAGYKVKAFTSFPDHFIYKDEDLRKLRMRARVERAALITTEKDHVRLPLGSRENILVLPVGLTFKPKTALEALLKEA
jgi:tetraacyldisaccharide 4'-kinase